MQDREISKWLKIESTISELQRYADERTRVEETAGVFIKGLAEIFKPADCAIFLIDHRGENILAGIGIQGSTPEINYFADMPLMHFFSLYRTSIFAGNGFAPPPEAGPFPGASASSLICTPVFNAGRSVGFICLSSSRNEAFTQDDVRLVELASGEISMFMRISALCDKVETIEVRDELTGCYNLKKFAEDIEIEIPCADRYGRSLSLLKIEIDSFNEYYETHGRTMGDEILKKVGETLTLSLRMCDRVYHCGVEEFIIIMPGIDKERAVFAGSRLQKVLAQLQFAEEDKSQPVGKMTFSIGVVSFPADAVFRDGLLKKLDLALKKAREAGGNTVVSP